MIVRRIGLALRCGHADQEIGRTEARGGIVLLMSTVTSCSVAVPHLTGGRVGNVSKPYRIRYNCIENCNDVTTGYELCTRSPKSTARKRDSMARGCSWRYDCPCLYGTLRTMV